MALGREKHHSSRHCAKKKKSNGNSLMIAKSFQSNPLNVIFMHHRHKSGADSLCCEGKCILLLLQIISIVRSRLPLLSFTFLWPAESGAIKSLRFNKNLSNWRLAGKLSPWSCCFVFKAELCQESYLGRNNLATTLINSPMSFPEFDSTTQETISLKLETQSAKLFTAIAARNPKPFPLRPCTSTTP